MALNQSADRAKALEAAFAQINKRHGENTVMRLDDRPEMKVETFSTGSLAIDLALGVGGLPRGRVVEIYGPESSGKTTMTLHALASVQQLGGTAAFVDAEHALDPDYARNLGVDTENLIISQPNSGEEALDVTETLVNSGAVDIVVVDSVAALTPRKELEGEMGDSSVGLQARLMSQALRKITAAVNNTKCTVVFINQLREKIGVMFGSPETTTGGKALKFYASVRMDIRRIETLKEGTDAVGNRTRVKIVKNKIAPPFKQAETDIIYGTGFSREGDILDLGVLNKIVKKGGAWFSYQSDPEDPKTSLQLGQGKEKSRQFLIDNPELAQEIEDKIRAVYLPKPEEKKTPEPEEASTESGE